MNSPSLFRGLAVAGLSLTLSACGPQAVAAAEVLGITYVRPHDVRPLLAYAVPADTTRLP